MNLSHQAPRAFAALLSLAMTVGLVASLGVVADQQHHRAWLAHQQTAPAHTASASAAAPAQPRI